MAHKSYFTHPTHNYKHRIYRKYNEVDSISADKWLHEQFGICGDRWLFWTTYDQQAYTILYYGFKTQKDAFWAMLALPGPFGYDNLDELIEKLSTDQYYGK